MNVVCKTKQNWISILESNAVVNAKCFLYLSFWSLTQKISSFFDRTIFHLGSSSSFHPRKISDEPDTVHMSTLQNCDPHMHRLQRQDAKSRKTFKIKRNRSTIKNSMTRSATVKGGTKYHAMLLEGTQEQSVTEPDPVEPESEEAPGLARCIVPNASIKRKMGVTSATDLEMQPVASEVPTQNDQAAEGETSKAPKVGYCQRCKYLLGNFVASVSASYAEDLWTNSEYKT